MEKESHTQIFGSGFPTSRKKEQMFGRKREPFPPMRTIGPILLKRKPLIASSSTLTLLMVIMSATGSIGIAARMPMLFVNTLLQGK